MEFNIEAKEINDFLAKFGGIDSGIPRFHLVHTSDTLELRTGEYNIFAGSIFIRTEIATKEVIKYWYLPPTWVIEQWFSPDVAYSPELPDSVNGSYEPLFVFADKNNKPLPLNKRVVEIIMFRKFLPAASPMARISAVKLAEEMEDKRIEAYFQEITEDNGSGKVGEADLVHEGHGIFMPNKELIWTP